MNKTNYSNIVIVIAIIVLALVAYIIFKNNNVNKGQLPSNPIQEELDNAVKSDSTQSINDSLNKIDLNDTIDTDLTTVDQNLQKL